MKKEILIVEDCTLTKTWLTEQFYSTDYEVNSVDLGEDCISYIQELKPSLILLDISMPGISGLGLLDYIRSIHDMTELPVTIITSSDDKEILTDVLSAGANDYFIKPIDPVILMAKINLQIQFNSIQFNSIQFNSIQFNSIQFNSINITPTI